MATVMWVMLVLSVTLARSLPSAPASAVSLVQALAVVGALSLILVKPAGSARPRLGDGVRPLVVACIAIPTTALMLATWRGEPGDGLNHVASLLSIVLVCSLAPRIRTESITRGLVVVVLGSLLAGLVYAPFVLPNERSFVRSLYDGRLSGLGGSPNMLAQLGLVLVVFSLLFRVGRGRLVGVGVGLAGIVAASSNTSLLAFGVVAAVYTAAEAVRRGAHRGVLVALWLITLAALAVTFRLVSDPEPAWSDLSFSSRTSVWEFLLSQQIPFFGIGQSKLAELFEGVRIQGAIGVSSAHNMFLDAYVRDGYPGLFVVLAFIVLAVVVIVHRRAWFALVPLAAFVVVGLSEVTPTHVPMLAMLFAAIITALRRGAEGPALGDPARTHPVANPHRVPARS